MPRSTTPDQIDASKQVAGMLLTGGASRRMGSDKAMLEVGGVANAVRLAGLLREVSGPVLEVGPGRSGLRALSEQPPGQGALAAVAAGGSALRELGCARPALVLACDLPFVGGAVLRFLVGWPGTGSVVPVVGGRPQPLCARWSAEESGGRAGTCRGGRAFHAGPAQKAGRRARRRECLARGRLRA